MKKETITLIDYCGSCDGEGKAIGHSPKVLMEYADLLKDHYKLEAILPLCIHETVKTGTFDRITNLPYQIVEEGNRGLLKRLVDKYKLFRNIRLANRYSEHKICWYYRTDFFLFLYYFFHRKPDNKVMICLLYQQTFADGLPGEILDYVFRKGLSKFDAVIYTQKGMKIPHSKTFYMPDYIYDATKYEQYRKLPKDDKVVCLGTMNPYKELEKLVEVFNVNGIRLEIIGKFLDEQRYRKLQCIAKDNIMIKDAILPEDDYYRKLAGAKYSIMPYNMKIYEGRTSGVLQETIFVGTIPVAPKQLLKENNIPGIGYEDLRDLAPLSLGNSTDESQCISSLMNMEVISNTDQMNKKNIKDALCKWVRGLIDDGSYRNRKQA